MFIPNVQDPRIPSKQYKETYAIRIWQCVITEAGVMPQPSTAKDIEPPLRTDLSNVFKPE